MKDTRECAVCPATSNLKACSRCKEAFYCSTEHAKLIHKPFCGSDVEVWYEEELTKAEVDALHAVRDHCSACGIHLPLARRVIRKHLAGWPEADWTFPEASPSSSTPRLQSWVRSTRRELLFDITQAHLNAGFLHHFPINGSPIPKHITELPTAARGATYHPSSPTTTLGEQLFRRFLVQSLNFDHLTRWVEKAGPIRDMSFEGLGHVKVALNRLRAMEDEGKKVLELTDQRGLAMLKMRAQNACLDMTSRICTQ
ncbi:hypothetical protein BCR35DRAFT_328361 [Leucosporidium creatinivorum]|uniref:MYND-type domain-containing protein n=1 Tax=Leucosporidium creatinivorum TaxID=106004 RepID=A0A1Y2G329_9BASI|nr:hypothetical protein BCR35DRAFT_328361 [Leucosporidium creatinivorum]